ncbi:MAG: class I SAM-dependent methyltransferase, partial [Oscillospiraceae bacterium]|nr:class I SAM-dependent methyltransferase [Oscillospiraceae bacterium]
MKDNLSAYNANDYDNHINSVLPYYQEFHAQIIDLIQVLNNNSNNNIQWLDTGCGTGTLAEKIMKNFANINLTLCDPSEKMLAITKQKLNKYNNIKFINVSTQHMQFENEFDVITAVQAHHYLTMENRA